MNILFVLYHDFTANSAVHVHNFANQLALRGNNIAVAVPDDKQTGQSLGQQLYRTFNFAELNCRAEDVLGESLDIVHAWTPRENVRLFCEALRHSYSFHVVVHLEDNEELITEINLQTPFAELTNSDSTDIPLGLSHPRLHREFLNKAAGVTIIMDRLERFVPHAKPKAVIWPGADTELFCPQSLDQKLRARLKVPLNSTVLCYTGNVHAANAREVRSLYIATAMLNREGVATTLVRAGRDYCSFLGDDDRWARKYCIELGYVKHVDIPRVLSLADVLIQPGKSDLFNEYRLPSKLPEFFAMGRPVILPQTNIGRFVNHGEHAWVLPEVNALSIVEALKELIPKRALLSSLGEGAQRFAKENFDWSVNAGKLETFYRSVLGECGQVAEILPTITTTASRRTGT